MKIQSKATLWGGILAAVLVSSLTIQQVVAQESGPRPAGGQGQAQGQGQRVGVGGGGAIAVDNASIYVLQGNRVLRLDKNSLEVVKEAQLPNPRPGQGQGTGPGSRPGAVGDPGLDNK